MDGTYSDLQLVVLVTDSVVLRGSVCVGVVMCVVTSAFSCAFRRLSGERSICLLSVAVGDLDPDLQTAKETRVTTAQLK